MTNCDDAWNKGYLNGYLDAMDDYHAHAMEALDVVAPKASGVCGWLRGQLQKSFNMLREAVL